MTENNDYFRLATVDYKDYWSNNYTEKQVELMQQWDNKQWALWVHFGAEENLIESISELDINSIEVVEFQNTEHWVLTDDEADDRNYESVEDFVEDELGRSHWLLNYVDIQKLVDDGDRANNLAGYDGREIEYDVNGESIYLYKVNDWR